MGTTTKNQVTNAIVYAQTSGAIWNLFDTLSMYAHKIYRVFDTQGEGDDKFYGVTRFTGITIPTGATINNATLKVYALATSPNATATGTIGNTSIRAQADSRQTPGPIVTAIPTTASVALPNVFTTKSYKLIENKVVAPSAYAVNPPYCKAGVNSTYFTNGDFPASTDINITGLVTKLTDTWSYSNGEMVFYLGSKLELGNSIWLQQTSMSGASTPTLTITYSLIAPKTVYQFV